MKRLFTKQKGSYFLVGIFLLLMCACNDSVSDADLQEQITADLHANEKFKAVEISVVNGAVSLTGTCDGENCADEAGDQVKDMDGVKSLDNQVKRRETDLTMRSSVQSIISKYQGVQADVAAGVIVLRGSIVKDQLQPLMTELEALRPQKIDNQLAIKQ